jgi:hypothetical protein
MGTKIKVRDIKNLLKLLEEQIDITEKFIIEHAIVPIDYDDEAYETISKQVKSAMSKLDGLYDELSKLSEVVKSALYRVSVDSDNGKIEYAELLASRNKINVKVGFLKSFAERLWRVGDNDKPKFIPVLPEFTIVSEHTKALNALYAVEKQLNDIDNSIEIDINIDKPEIAPEQE